MNRERWIEEAERAFREREESGDYCLDECLSGAIAAYEAAALEDGHKMTPRALTQAMVDVNYNDRFPVPSPSTCCDQWAKMWDVVG